jgi:hypothetical protein
MQIEISFDAKRAEIESRLERAFVEFHEKNPQVYERLVKLARDLRARNRSRKLGIGMLYEVVRWMHFMETTDEEYKLNNNHRSRYARMIMRNEPDLADAFEVRELADERASV